MVIEQLVGLTCSVGFVAAILSMAWDMTYMRMPDIDERRGQKVLKTYLGRLARLEDQVKELTARLDDVGLPREKERLRLLRSQARAVYDFCEKLAVAISGSRGRDLRKQNKGDQS